MGLFIVTKLGTSDGQRGKVEGQTVTLPGTRLLPIRLRQPLRVLQLEISLLFASMLLPSALVCFCTLALPTLLHGWGRGQLSLRPCPHFPASGDIPSPVREKYPFPLLFLRH